MERRISAIFAADMVGYSRLMEADEIGTLERQKTHRKELINPAFEQFHGRIVKEMGDGLLVEFPSIIEAVQCAVEIQRAMPQREAEIPDDHKISYRIGINLGDIVVEEDDIYGSGVNVAARLEALAEPGGICLSGTAYDHLGSAIEVGYESLGEVSVKNIERSIRAYRVLTDPAQVSTIPTITRKRKVNRNTAGIGLLLLLLSLGATGWWWLQPVFEPTDAKNQTLKVPDKPSIAILPFANLSDDTEREYFAEGFTEDLTSNVAQSKDLFVISRNSTLAFKSRPVNIQEVASDLGVRYVLEGSIRPIGDKVRVTAQLIDSSNDSHIWAKQYDVPMSGIFDVQDELTREISGSLLANIRRADLNRTLQKRPNDLSAYDYVLRARAMWDTPGKEAKLEARALAEKAIALDPNYAPAYAILGDTYNSAYILQWEGPEALDKAYELARKAVELDPLSSQSHELLGRVFLRRNQHNEAIITLRKAIELNPNRSFHYAALADVLTFANRPDEAIELMNTAIRLDPFYPARDNMYLGRAYFFTEKYEEAMVELETCAARTPRYRPCYMYLAPTYAQMGKSVDASRTVGELLRISPDFSISNSVRGHLPFVEPAIEFYISALRKAGVPE